MTKFRNSYFILFLFISFFSCYSSTNTIKKHSSLYNEEKAIKYGADEYGMKKYVIAFLKSGPNKENDPQKRQALQRSHLENINRLAETGKLIVAGPFLDNSELRGIYIFNVESIEEAKELTATDPSVIAGSLIMELKPWYGPAALLEINEIQKTLTKSDITK